MSAPTTGTWRPIIHNRTFWAAVLLGVGTMAAIDEIVFHQLLQWHHFFDPARGDLGIVSDGLLHAGELLALGTGFFLLLDARRRGDFTRPVAASGYLVGLGGFQLFDGIIDHKVLQIHQIRYWVDLLPYDIIWNGAGAVLLLTGISIALLARDERPTEPTPRTSDD
ncbi:DUF2243 domain-containing protein [Microbacterium sp. W4I20]|uniref:DUF2243 domain-containing protein n=1 Tax=Microbacterium sp. W4I20 TaxID=3042262 RepID=UPI002781591D|nr:DUF2243 domain-containing protein [Microbacterium sp. W4I20]MDQ0729131.1 putative membrane protein [Microbacterium sp. W4I20]